MSQAFYRTWRPATWDEVVGQDHVIQTLRNAVSTNRVSQAYLFSGPRGTGKTTTARLLAKAVNCLHEDRSKRSCNTCINCQAINEGRFLDLIEIDAASNTSVDDVRELREKINFSPSQGTYKVYIIDEVHMLSTSAFNALLKTLEEPPQHVIFILATTEIHKIPATVLSRCQRYDFRRIPIKTIVEKLKAICEKEEITIDEQALSLIARQATGSLRDAISLVDQLSSLEKTIDLALAQDILGTATNEAVVDLVDALLDEQSGKGLEIIHKTLDSGADARHFARQIVEYLRTVLIFKLGGGKDLELLPEIRSAVIGHSKQFDLENLIAIIASFNDASTDLKANWHPGLGLELALAFSISRIKTALNKKNPESYDEKSETSSTISTDDKVVNKKEPDVKEIPAEIPPETDVSEKKERSDNPDLVDVGMMPDGQKPVTVDSFDMNMVRLNWEQIKKKIRMEDQITGALFNSSKLQKVAENTITLNFSSYLLRDRVMEEKPQRVIQKVLTSVFGHGVSVICTVGELSEETNENSEIKPDGLVDLTLREFGGKVRKTEVKKKGKE